MRSLRFPLVKAAAIAAAFLLLAPLIAAAAETYPTRPIRIVVAYAPGGSTDLVARLIGQELGQKFGWRVIIDNRPGGGTIIGTDMVARATPDGYTLFYGTNATVINTVLKKKLPYKLEHLEPVTNTIVQPLGILAGPRLKVDSLKGLIAHAKANPGKLNFASSGNGSLQHIAGEMLRDMAEIDVVHVPYKGAGPAMNDLLGGNVDFMITSLLGNAEHIKNGRLKLLATTGGKRSPATPQTPAVAELLPGYEATSWQALFAPAGTPRPVIERLHSALKQVATSKPFIEKLAANAMEVRMSTPAEARELVYGEQKKYAAIVKKTGAKFE